MSQTMQLAASRASCRNWIDAVSTAAAAAQVLFVIISLDRSLRGPMAIPADSYERMSDHERAPGRNH
jgi:hypothetical protein